MGNGSCDILLAAGEALLEPGAELVYAWPSFSVYPHLPPRRARARSAVAARRDDHARPRRDGHRDHRGDAAGHRLQPQQPDVDGGPARGDRGVPRARPAPRRGDPRRGLLRVQPARRPGRARSTCCPGTPTSCCCGRSRRSTGCAGCASASACAARPTSAAPSTRSASRSSATPLAQAAAVEALKHQDEVAERVERAVAARLQLDAGLRELGIEPAESQANFAWFDLPASAEVEDDVVSGLAERGVLVRAGTALGQARRAAGHLRHARAERQVPRRAARASVARRRHA